MHILIVDDDPISLSIISTILKKWNYQVTSTNNGLDALSLVRRENISFVISDWNMPGLDGPQLCRQVRAESINHYIYFILLTIREDKTSLIEGMDAGADDFLIKPMDPKELRARIRAGERVLNLEKQLKEHNEQLDRLNRSLQQAYEEIKTRSEQLDKFFQIHQQGMEAAAVMQKELLPKKTTLQGVKIEWLFRPNHILAGDMFGYFRLSENYLSFYHLDVAGHGIPAALLSFMLSKTLLQGIQADGLLKNSIKTPPYYEVILPSQVVKELNRRFEADNDSLIYFTMVYGLIETVTGHITLTQAGHPSPFWLQRSKGKILKLGSGGFPVGLLADADYDVINFNLSKGDRLFLYSDGITECENPAGELFSESRLLEILEYTADQSLPSVMDILAAALRNWRGDERYLDDISLLALERES